MKIIYFDICSIPVYLLILWTCYARKLNEGHSNKIFILLNWTSLFCAIIDIVMEFVVNPAPITALAATAGMIISFTYKLMRNACMVIYILYIFSVTRTEYRLRPLKNRLVLWLPNAGLLILLLQNFFTHNVFSVTMEAGYQRGPLLTVFYLVAAFYGIIGCAYCVFCKRYLPTGKWLAILSVYVLTFLGVGIQMIYPRLLVEMFSTSVGVMMILLLVMRPEETMDGTVGLQNYNTYLRDLKNLLLIGEKAQIIAMQIVNTREIRAYLGEERYNELLSEIGRSLSKIYAERNRRVDAEVYIERPGTFYLTLDEGEYDLTSEIEPFLAQLKEKVGTYTGKGVRFDVKICLIRIPDVLSDRKEIINLGHKFPQLGRPNQVVFYASEIIKSRDYEIISHMDEILNRAIAEDSLMMVYQPIYNNKTRQFHSAEALARLKDPQYGIISPAIFIPAAEDSGLILTLGNAVLEKVFRFMASYDLEALGLSYLEINLSVAQVLQSDLPQVVQRLQERYHIKPSQVNFEITETLNDSISDVMDRNVRELRRMGYHFSLDDYGIGYSNIQRMSKLPLDIIKIDKSLVDEMFTEDGQVIIKNTVRMMQGIHKELIIEGVETREEMEALANMACDYIQGFYYSKPLPEKQFVQFLKENNFAA